MSAVMCHLCAYGGKRCSWCWGTEADAAEAVIDEGTTRPASTCQQSGPSWRSQRWHNSIGHVGGSILRACRTYCDCEMARALIQNLYAKGLGRDLNSRDPEFWGTWRWRIWRSSCRDCSRYNCAWRRGQSSRAGGQRGGRPWMHRPVGPGTDGGGDVKCSSLWCIPGCCSQVWRPRAVRLLWERKAGEGCTRDAALSCEGTDS